MKTASLLQGKKKSFQLLPETEQKLHGQDQKSKFFKGEAQRKTAKVNGRKIVGMVFLCSCNRVNSKRSSSVPLTVCGWTCEEDQPYILLAPRLPLLNEK